MITVKCPKCAAALELAQAPPSGRVKCPKCATVVGIKAPTGAGTGGAAASQAAAANSARSSQSAGGSADPDDGNFDFGRINFPSASAGAAVNHFPVASGASLYQGPIPGDPLESADTEGAGGDTKSRSKNGGPSATKKKKAGMSTAAMVRMLIGIALLIVCTIIAAVVWMHRANRGPSSAEQIAKLQQDAPAGYQAVGIHGVIVLMPEGSDYDNLPSVIDCLAMDSTESGSVYFLGAMNGGSRPLDKDQLRKKAEKQLGGEILGGQETERNGYKGIKGVLDGSVFVPRMMVEVFHVDERFCILGCAPKSMGADPSVPVDRALEAKEQKVFFDSFSVGPKPSGFGFLGN